MAMELLATVMPANVTMLYDLLKDTINFQPIPADTIYDTLIAGPFDLETSEEKREAALKRRAELDENDVEDPSALSQAFAGRSVLRNVLFVILALIALAFMILIILACRSFVLKKCCKPIVSLFRLLERKIMMNAVLRALLESYL